MGRRGSGSFVRCRARVAGLLAIAALGIVVASSLNLEGLHRGLIATAVLLAIGGLISAFGIRNPAAEDAAEAPRIAENQ